MAKRERCFSFSRNEEQVRYHDGRDEQLTNRRMFLTAAGGTFAASAVYQVLLSPGPKAEDGDSGPSSLKRMGGWG